MSTRTARLTIGTALQLGKTFLAFLYRQIVSFVLAFAFAFAFDLSLAFALALALALPIESLPRDHSYRVQLQSFYQRVVRLWVFARVTQQSGEVRLMDFVVFRLILLTIVVVRNAFLPVSGCVSQLLDGFSLCQTGAAHDVANDWEKRDYLLAWVSHAHDGVRRSAVRARLLRWLSWCVVFQCTSTPCSARTG